MTDIDGHFNTSVVDLMAIQPARLTNTEGRPSVALLTFRLEPSESYAVRNIALTQQQCIRLRDDLNLLLTDTSSWLFTEEALHVREESPIEFDFDAQ
jgi:hypothetical protein